MESNFKKIAFLFILLIFTLISCEENSTETIEYDPAAVKVSGTYHAIKFIYPDYMDGSIDVLEHSGYINLILHKDLTAEGEWKLPKVIFHDGEDLEQSFNGTYSIVDDTINFHDFSNTLSNPQIYFLIREDTLKANLQSISPIIINLLKTKE